MFANLGSVSDGSHMHAFARWFVRPRQETSTPAFPDRVAQALQKCCCAVAATRHGHGGPLRCLFAQAVLSRYDQLPGRGKPQGAPTEIIAKEECQMVRPVMDGPGGHCGREVWRTASAGQTQFCSILQPHAGTELLGGACNRDAMHWCCNDDSWRGPGKL